MVNKRKEVWKYYKEVSTSTKNCSKRNYECTFCGKIYLQNATRMIKHIRTCVKCPSQLKTSFQSDESSEKLNISSTFLTSQTSSSKGEKELKQRTMKTFCDSISPIDQDIVEEKLARAVYASGSPLAIFESPFWQDAFQHIRPALQLPSRKRLSQTLLDEEFNRVKIQVDTKVAECKYVSLQCDGWSNIRNESIVNFVLTTPEPVFFKSFPTETASHTGEYMAEIMSQVIEEVGSEKTLSCITDNASNMKKAWDILQEKYPHMSFYGCVAHALNLLIQDLLKINSILSLRNEASKIVDHIKASHILTAHFSKIQSEKNVKISLKLPVKTRWGSIIRCFRSLKDNKFCLQALAINEEVGGYLSKQTKSTILDDDIFWARLENTLELLQPIGEWITKIEGDKPMPSLIPEMFADLAQVFELRVPQSPATKVEEKKMMEMLINRREFCMHKFHLAANILDPRFQGARLSQSENVDGLEFISTLAEHMNDVNDEEVLIDFAKYKAKDGLWAKNFVWKNVGRLDSRVWWNGMCSTSPLSKVASAILAMPVTSAATERSFSAYGNIHTKKRNRLDTQRAGKIVYIGHNLKLFRSQATISLPEVNEGPGPSGLQLLQGSTTCTVGTKSTKTAGSKLRQGGHSKRLKQSVNEEIEVSSESDSESEHTRPSDNESDITETSKDESTTDEPDDDN